MRKGTPPRSAAETRDILMEVAARIAGAEAGTFATGVGLDGLEFEEYAATVADAAFQVDTPKGRIVAAQVLIQQGYLLREVLMEQGQVAGSG